jgi:exonuclease III
MNRHTTLSILQYNVHKSRDMVMASMLRDPRIHEYDILAIQEPWRNPFAATTHHPAKSVFHLCCPAEEEAGPARVCFFINKRLDHKKWQFKEHSRDTCSLRIEFGDDQQERQHITIHNIYNPARRSESNGTVLSDIRTVLHNNQANEQILLGDFNLHHPMWGGANVRYTDPESADLLAIMEDFNLDSTLPPGTITYEKRTSRTALDTYVQEIAKAIQKAIDQAKPYTRPSDRMREGLSD